MGWRSWLKHRRGASLVETAFIGSVFLILVLGALDLGISVLRFNSISQAARMAVREAIVHGDLAPAGWNGGNWGAVTLTVQASNTEGGATPAGALAQAARPALVACDLDATTITAEWPDGSNVLERPVRVTVTTTTQPVLTFLFGGGFDLRAVATMPMAHSRPTGG